MAGTNKNIPTPEQVRLIFKYTYMIYVKYKNSKSDQDFLNLVKLCHEIQRRFPFKLCEKVLLEICNIIEEEYKKRYKLEKNMDEK